MVLQRTLFLPGRLSLIDWAAVLVHWSFFLVPHAVPIALFIWKPKVFPRYVATVLGTLYLGLLPFFALPTTPPWLAGQLGALPPYLPKLDLGGRPGE